MPIGKNSIKRVKNNGYSSVKTSAPDMENSTVLANPSPEVIEKMIPSAKGAKADTKKADSTKKSTPVSKKQTTTPKAKSTKNVNKDLQKSKEISNLGAREDGFVRVALGDDLPTYLL